MEEVKPQGLGGIARRKNLLARPRCRWMDNTKVDDGEVGRGGTDRIGQR
jgi:hypothetical protein